MVRTSQIHDLIKEKNNGKEFINKSIKRDNTYLRQVFCYLAYKNCSISLNGIGYYIGYYRGKKLNHSTVIYSINKIKDYLDVDKKTQKMIVSLEEEIKILKNTKVVICE